MASVPSLQLAEGVRASCGEGPNGHVNVGKPVARMDRTIIALTTHSFGA